MPTKGQRAYFDENGNRYCTACGKMKSRAEFTGEGKFAKSVCKECKITRASKAKDLELGKKLGDSIAALEDKISRGVAIPHTADLVEALMDVSGGVRMIAQLYWEHVSELEPGTLTCDKAFQGLFKLISTNAAQGGAKKPLKSMDRKELYDHLQSLVGPEMALLDEASVVDEEPFDETTHMLPPPEEDDGVPGSAAG